jgi:hypothetical protein
LTPGEFVFNKKAADSIGRANLDRMNKQGVQGFAKGGSVGVQRFNSGGSAQKGRSLGLSGSATIPGFGGVLNDLNDVERALKRVGVSGEELRVAMDTVEQELNDGTSQAESFGKAFDNFKNNAAQAQKQLEKTRANPTSGDTVAIDTKLSSAANLGGGRPTSSFGEAAKTDASIAKSLEEQQKKEISAIAREIRSIDKNVSAKDALIRAENVVRNEYGVLGKEIKDQIQATGKMKQALARASGAMGAVRGFVGKGVAGLDRATGGQAGRQGFANQANSMASAAQSAVFLGASVAAVTSQMSGLSEVTKQAINETAGFATGIVGIGGTLVQILTSMAASNTQAAVASQIAATADTEEAAASSAAAASGAKFATGAGIAVAAFAILATVLKYQSSAAKAQADAIGKERKARLDSIKETGTSDVDVSELENGISEELALRQRSAELFNKEVLIGTGLGVAGFAAAGAAIGSTVPILGTAIGAAAGALVGYVAVQYNANKAVSDAENLRRKEAESIREVYEANIALSQASYQLNSDLSAIEAAPGLEGPEKTRRRLEAQQIGAGEVSRLAGKTREKTLADAETLGITQAQLKSLTPDEVRTKGAEKELDQTVIDAIALRSEAAFQTLEDAAKLASTRVQETGKTLQGAIGDLEFGQGREAIESQKLFAQATRAARQAIIEEQAIKLQGVTDEKSRQAIIAEGNSRLKNFDDGINATINAKKTEQAAIERATAAQVALSKAIQETDAFLKLLNNIELNLDKQSDALDNFAAIIDNTAFKIKASGVDEIGDIANVRDLAKFSSQISSLTGKFGPEAQKIGNELTQSASVLKNARGLIGKNFGLSGTINADQVLKNLGLTKETLGPGGKKIFDEIASSLSGIKGEITEADIADAFAPLEAISSEQAKVLQRLVGVNQKEIDNFVKFLDNKEKLRQKEIEQKQKEIQAIQKFAETQDKVTSLLAKSRGVEEDPAANARRQRLRAQRGVRARNQATVSGITVNGSQLNAGNIGQVSRVRKSALAERRQIQQRIAAGESGKKLIARQKALQNVIDSTTKVLQEFNESGQEIVGGFISEIEANISAIEKERQSRQAVIGVLEEFVVGGQEARVGIVNAFAGVRQAFATGSLQFQNPEQRAATVGLLDKLADIELAPGFTGSQIKQELILRDTRALQGIIPPELIIALANSETAEQKLVKTNEALAIEIRKLTAATVASVKALGGDEPAVGAATGGLIQYRQNGGTIFQPKGTDTVPAMLTPGEFVIRKSAVDKVGVGALQQINNGGSLVPGFSRGGVVYRENGSTQSESNVFSVETLMAMKKFKRIRNNSQLDMALTPGGFQGLTATEPEEIDYLNNVLRPQIKQKEKFQESQAAFRKQKTLAQAYFARRGVAQLTIPTTTTAAPQDESQTSRGSTDSVGSLTKKQLARLMAAGKNIVSAAQEGFSNFKNNFDPAPAATRSESLYKDLRPKFDPGPANIARLQNLSLQGIDPEKVEKWTDNTGKFSTQAKYRGITDAFQGKGTNTGTNTILNLEKKDGTGIGVPKDKLSDESKSLAAKYYRALGYAKGGEVDYLRFGGFGGSSFGRGYGAQSSLGAAYGQMFRNQSLMANRASIGRNRMFGRAAAGFRFMRGRAAAGLGVAVPQGPALSYTGGTARPFDPEEWVLNYKTDGGIETNRNLEDVLTPGIDPRVPADTGEKLQRAWQATGGNISKRGLDVLLADVRGKVDGRTMDTIDSFSSVTRGRETPLPGTAGLGAAAAVVPGAGAVDPAVFASLPPEVKKYVDGTKYDFNNPSDSKSGIERLMTARAEGFSENDALARLRQIYQENVNRGEYSLEEAQRLYNRVIQRYDALASTYPDLGFAAGGKVPYFASGGATGGDSIPAMLTPGEFVMNANTVKKYGVGFMNQVNKGNLPGFNKGGMVQYRQNGGMMDMFSGAAQSFGIDTSKIEGVFGGFVDSFSSVFDNIIGPFSGIAESLRSITEAFGNFDMQHTVCGDLSLNIQGVNSEVLKSEISKYVVDIIGTEVQRVMNDQQKNFKSA